MLGGAGFLEQCELACMRQLKQVLSSNADSVRVSCPSKPHHTQQMSSAFEWIICQNQQFGILVTFHMLCCFLFHCADFNNQLQHPKRLEPKIKVGFTIGCFFHEKCMIFGI